jgi:hypothetical protein
MSKATNLQILLSLATTTTLATGIILIGYIFVSNAYGQNQTTNMTMTPEDTADSSGLELAIDS